MLRRLLAALLTSGVLLTCALPARAQTYTSPAAPVTNRDTNVSNAKALGALNAAIAIPTNGYGDWSAQITSANFNGTISFQGSIDGINWTAIAARQIGVSVVSGTVPTSYTAAGAAGQFAIFHGSAAPFTQVQLIATGYTAGSAAVILSSTQKIAAFSPLTPAPGASVSAPGATTGISAATVTTSLQTAAIDVTGMRELDVTVQVAGSVTGTTPTLALSLQTSPDNGATFVTKWTTTVNITATGTFFYDFGAGFLSATAQPATIPIAFGNKVKLTLTAGGTTPSFGGVTLSVAAK